MIFLIERGITFIQYNVIIITYLFTKKHKNEGLIYVVIILPILDMPYSRSLLLAKYIPSPYFNSHLKNEAFMKEVVPSTEDSTGNFNIDFLLFKEICQRDGEC